MSLTKDEWARMWEAAKTIEVNAKALRSTNALRGAAIQQEVEFIKQKIQQVIGQME